MERRQVKIENEGRELVIAGLDGQGGSQRFHAVWLRDNARDEQTLSAKNGQKLIRLLDQPADPRISAASIAGDELELAIDGANYSYPLSWLAAHDYSQDSGGERSAGWVSSERSLWHADLLASADTSFKADYRQLLDDDAVLLSWLTAFSRYGIALVAGFPQTDEDAIIKVAERFGYIRPTNYGQVFEVRTELNPTNLAFTGLGLEVHTDNPYRDPVPTIQLLACMENSAEGGDSIVVDGFAAAKTLQETRPEAFALLAKYPVGFRYAGSDDVDLSCHKPIIELAPDGELVGVRFNNRSIAPLDRVLYDQVPAFYQAMRDFAELLNEPKLQVPFKLDGGELFMVDNRRVLHGRAAVVGAGNRWLRGCYADIDGLESTRRVLASKLGVKS